MFLKRYRPLQAAIVPGVLALVALTGSGCGGGDDKSKASNGPLEVSVSADRFAGPTPLDVKFSAKPKNAEGEVHYRWRFDDGTQSEEVSPSHSFPRAGYYTVILDARDESGNNTRQSLLLGAWPPHQWSSAQTKPLTKKGALETQKIQQGRTDARHKDLREALRKKLEAGS
jgi:PKD domain